MKYLDDIEASVDNINTCEELNKAKADLQKWADDTIAKLGSNLTLVASITAAPTEDLTKIVKWITDAIAVITGMITEVTDTITAITTQVTRILGKITDKLATLGCSG